MGGQGHFQQLGVLLRTSVEALFNLLEIAVKAALVAATVLLLGPLAGFAGARYAMASAHRAIAEEGGDADPKVLASHVADAVSFKAAGFLTFIAGVLGHLFIAWRSIARRPWAWYLILAASLLYLLDWPLGTIAGGVAIVLLLSLGPFKRMREVEHARATGAATE